MLLCAVSLVAVTALGAPISAAAAEDHTHRPGDSVVADTAGTASTGITTDDLNPGQIVMSFHVRSDGTATASVGYWIRLDDSTSTAAFTRFKRDLSGNRSRYVDRIERRMRATVENAERTTGRPMSVENVTLRAYRSPQDYGIVKFSFVWHGFAAVREDRITIGRALGGLHLSNTTRLLISWPQEYEVHTVSDTLTDRREQSAIWAGPTTFGRSGPHVVLTREGGVYAGLVGGLMPLAGGALFVLGSGVVVWRWRADEEADAPLAALAPLPGFEADAGEADDAGGDTAAAGTGTDAEPPTSAGPPPELLSNSETLLRELRQRGGRAKQKELVEALDWSDAKGSRVVSDLREDDEVETFRLGNENVLTLPEQDLTEDTERGDNDA